MISLHVSNKAIKDMKNEEEREGNQAEGVGK